MAPTKLQAWHVPSQAVLQHTPSTQLPEAHWSAAVQDRPGPFFRVHTPLSQKWPGLQLALPVQAVVPDEPLDP
jgi:hypothetical protein